MRWSSEKNCALSAVTCSDNLKIIMKNGVIYKNTDDQEGNIPIKVLHRPVGTAPQVRHTRRARGMAGLDFGDLMRCERQVWEM